MTTEQLRRRVAELERTVADLQQKIAAGQQPGMRRAQAGRTLSPREQEAYDLAVEYGRYFRTTGRMPPDGWKPGDPIPEETEPTRPSDADLACSYYLLEQVRRSSYFC